MRGLHRVSTRLERLWKDPAFFHFFNGVKGPGFPLHRSQRDGFFGHIAGKIGCADQDYHAIG